MKIHLVAVAHFLILYCYQVPVHCNSLNGKHLKVYAFELPLILQAKRNASGHIVSTSGMAPGLWENLADTLNFTYSYVEKQGNLVDNAPNKTGAIGYLLNKEADLALGGFVYNSVRNRLIEYTQPWIFDNFLLLIPIPTVSQNIEAVIKPFQYQVWILVVISVIAVTVSLTVYSRLTGRHSILTEEDMQFNNFQSSFMYVFSILSSQGGCCLSSKWPVRFVASTWCLSAVVLVCSYSGVLISFVSTPIRHPLANSIEDVAKDVNIIPVLDQGLAADTIFQSIPSGMYKDIADRMRKDPSLRCKSTDECVAKVQLGNYVYIQVAPILKLFINDDYKKTGQCHYMLSREGFFNSYVSFMLPKTSPYTADINKGLTRLWQSGMQQVVRNEYQPEPRVCLNAMAKISSNVRLSLNGLSGAFAVLGVGCSISLLAFIVENVYYYKQKNAVAIQK